MWPWRRPRRPPRRSAWARARPAVVVVRSGWRCRSAWRCWDSRALFLRAEFLREPDQVLAEPSAQRLVLEAELDRRLQVTQLAAAVVALAFELVRVHRLVRE